MSRQQLNRRLLLSGVAVIASVSIAAAADIAPAPVYKAPVMAPVSAYNWSGFYLGVNAGALWGRSSDVTTVNSTGALVTSSSTSGNDAKFQGGGQIGFNWMLGPNFLWGIEVDSQYVDAKGSVLSPDGSNRHDTKFDYYGTARGRLGYAVDNWLFYGTGGLAWGHGQIVRTQIGPAALNLAVPGTIETVDNWRTGWAAGAGIEWALDRHWTAKAEYLHIDLGSATAVFPLADRRQVTTLQADIARVGVNYKFDWGGPVVARY
ncbi:MAG: porin family protein [Alphaproteobacteria bacterium]|nr:porin family protein [Alphaproteobacteria bacterium]